MRCRPHRREGRRLWIRHGHRGRGRSQGSSQRDRASRASRASRGAAGRNGRLGEAGLRLHIFGALRWAASVHQSNPALPGALGAVVRNLGLYVFHGQLWFVGHAHLSPTMSDDVLFFPFVCHAILQAEMRVQNQHKVIHVQETNSSTAAKVSGQSLSASGQYDNPA